MSVPQHILVWCVRLYRWTLSPLKVLLFGPLGRCRFTPTCSEYALEALLRHGALAGSWLAAKRIARCHPWGGCGVDPVPPHSALPIPHSAFRTPHSPRPRGCGVDPVPGRESAARSLSSAGKLPAEIRGGCPPSQQVVPAVPLYGDRQPAHS